MFIRINIEYRIMFNYNTMIDNFSETIDKHYRR
jgi:hypothetical protein